jgi:NTE family protein
MASRENPTDALNVVRQSSFLRGLSEGARRDAAARAQQVEFTPGERLSEQGAPAQALHLIASGLVRGSIFTNGVEEVLHQAGPGTLLGATALNDRNEAASWVAESNVVAFAWDRTALADLERTHPGISKQLGTALGLRDRARELVTAIHHSPLFRHTSPVLIAELVRRSTLVRAEAGSIVFSQGDPGNCFYVVVRGELEITRSTGDEGGDESVAVLWPGDGFGEMALVRGEPRNATARALRDSELLLVAREDFEHLWKSCSAFHRSLQGMIRERSGVASTRARRAEVWWFTNQTRYATGVLLSLLASEMEALGDRVAVVRISDDGLPAVSDATSLVVGTGAELGPSLDALSERRDLDYVLCFAEPAAESRIGAIIRTRSRRVIVLSEDVSGPVPEGAAGHDVLSWVEVRGPSWQCSGRSRFRRGTIPVPLPVGRDELGIDATRRRPDVRAEFARLARALTDRTVGVALGGGAAWGFAHIALIRAVLGAGVPIDMITGTSVGSMVGAFYASRGTSGLDAMVAARREIHLRAAACVVTSRPVTSFMRKHLAHSHLEDLPVPFFPVAVDIDAGRERIFRQGSIPETVRASCSLPGVFGPSDYEGRRYVDGCVMVNVPVDALIEEGADFVIASNIIPAPPPAGTRDERSRIGRDFFTGRVRDSLRALFLLYNVTGERQASSADVTFSPDLNPFLPTDFMKAEAIVARAEDQLGPVIREIEEKFAAFCHRSTPR